jgi:hypothetical protein
MMRVQTQNNEIPQSLCSFGMTPLGCADEGAAERALRTHNTCRRALTLDAAVAVIPNEVRNLKQNIKKLTL